jgi:dTMP kinase
VIFLREPGSTPIGEKIRKILLDKKNDQMTPESEMLLYMAARSQLVTQRIQPALKKGVIVVCDRFLDSTRAYQGFGLGMDMRIINSLGAFAARGIAPDLTVYIDLAPRQGLSARRREKDRIENRSLSYHQKVRRGYLALAKQEPKRIKVVKQQRDIAATQGMIRRIVQVVITS